MTPDETLTAIDDVIAWQGSPDAAHWGPPRPDEWADMIRPALATRIAADTGRDPADVGRELDEIHHAPSGDVDPARIVELLAPTAVALGQTAVTEVLARIEQAPAEVRGPVLAQLVQTLAPAVVQAVLAGEARHARA